jgi:peroxiredoxin
MIQHLRTICARILFFALLPSPVGIAANAVDEELHPGAIAPAFTLQDQDGKAQTLQSLAGLHGLLVLFSRSADWCALCKSQLIELEAARHIFEAKGIHVASITYDSPAVLKEFSIRRGIHFTLLLDPDSRTIDAFGVRNTEETGYKAGVAIPNYFLVGTDGKILRRFIEGTPQERKTANYLYEAIFRAGTAQPSAASIVPETPHLTVALKQSDVAVAPGARFQLTVQLEPGKDEHLYAPGAEAFGYRPIRLALDSSDLYQADSAVYGKSTIIEFASLKEKVPVFESSTQIMGDVWAVFGPKNAERFTQDPNLIVHGVLEYQVCNHTTCYAPETKPVSWTLRVLPGNFDRVRVAEALQRK